METEAKKPKQTTFRRNRTIFIVALLFIPLGMFLIRWVFINIDSFLLAFKDKNENWTLENFSLMYKNFTESEGQLKTALINTFKSFVGVELGVPISLFISYFIYKKIAGYKAFRTIYYLPKVISGIVYVTAFSMIVGPRGPLKSVCDTFGLTLPTEGLLYNRATATNTIIFYVVWIGACGNILFYSAMARVPQELIEYGQLEGITMMKELTHVILPLIWPTISTTLILDCTGILGQGGPILLFNNSAYGTTTLSYWFYMQVYGGGVNGIGSYGVMSATGLFFTVISVPIILGLRKLLDKVPTVEF